MRGTREIWLFILGFSVLYCLIFGTLLFSPSPGPDSARARFRRTLDGMGACKYFLYAGIGLMALLAAFALSALCG